MCEGSPASVTEALAQLRGALDFLNGSDAASEPSPVQAQVLRELERAESRHTAARARYLAAFTAQAEYEADGQGTARAWLTWQTQVTSGAAAGAVGWAKRLRSHPAIDQALAAGELSCSWAKHLCAWTDRLPAAARDGADQILAAAASDGGMGLRDLAGLAEEIYQRTRTPATSHDGDADQERAFADRQLRVGITFGGAGHTEGDLTPGCAHALTTVLAALGKKSGPEDSRTAGQRRHDALEEACRRLIAAGMVPGRAGQPTQLQVHMTLSQLLGLPGAGEAERAWIAAQATTHPGWLTGAEADAAACDATITPVVTGHLDPAALDALADLFQASRHPPATGHTADHPTSHTADPGATPSSAAPGSATSGGATPGSATPGSATPGSDRPPGPAHASGSADPSGAGPASGDCRQTGPPPAARPGTGTSRPGTSRSNTFRSGTSRPRVSQPGTDLAPASRDRLRRALLGLALQALSGPGGLAAHLRTTLTPTASPATTSPATADPSSTTAIGGASGTTNAKTSSGVGDATTATTSDTAAKSTGGVPARALLASLSLPLDIGAATPTIPAHLRKAAGIRHRHCAFPGCRQPVSACDLHHLIPRSQGGPTSLANLLPLCQFHHHTAIHRWGWTLQLHPDGSTTATSPDGSRAFHSHSPPSQAA